MKDLIKVIRRDGLALPLRSTIDCFLKASETNEEIKAVLGKTKTLQVAMSNNKKTRKERLFKNYRKAYNNFNHIFRTKADMLARKKSLAMICGKNLLKVQISTILFYHYPLNEDFKDLKIKIAHFDGRYTDAPRNYSQCVELRLVLGDAATEVTMTFARALLTSNTTESYREFFKCVRNANCKKIGIMVTDFEFAISRAAREVFPNIRIRGCWYHFWNNLLAKSGKLKRFTLQEPCRALIKTLSLLCFMHNPATVIDTLLDKYVEDTEDKSFKNVNIKFILYVYNTYVKRYGHIFFIDLSKSCIRTNNSAEGSNSGLSKFKNQRLSLQDFANYCELQWKREVVKKVNKIKPIKDIDIFLIEIQKVSKYNVEDLLVFLFKNVDKDLDSLKHVPLSLPKFSRKISARDLIFMQQQNTLIQQYHSEYRKFVNRKKREWKAFREKTQVHLIPKPDTGIDTEIAELLCPSFDTDTIVNDHRRSSHLIISKDDDAKIDHSKDQTEAEKQISYCALADPNAIEEHIPNN